MKSISKLSSPSGKKRSIFEEEFEHKEHEAAAIAKAQERREFNPLHPPGYKNPYNGTNWLVWGLALLGVVVTAIVIVMALQ